MALKAEKEIPQFDQVLHWRVVSVLETVSYKEITVASPQARTTLGAVPTYPKGEIVFRVGPTDVLWNIKPGAKCRQRVIIPLLDGADPIEVPAASDAAA